MNDAKREKLEELIGMLMAISVTSKKIAVKLVGELSRRSGGEKHDPKYRENKK